jgi:recombination protein RecA
LSKADDILGTLIRKYGEEIVVEGHEDIPRLSTGIFQFDLASGGGLPRGRVVEIYGKEGSGKTNLALKTIAQTQRLHPDRICVFIDIEKTYDPTWARRMGVNIDTLIVIRPDFAEQAVDIVDQFLKASDVILIVFDSIASLVTADEIERSAEKDTVGARARVMTKLVNKLLSGMHRAQKEKRLLTFLAINQIRIKIGVMFGSPETTPGGNAFRFLTSLRVRLHGTDVMDKKIHQSMWARKKTEFTIKRYKMPIVSIAGEYEMAMLPQGELRVGDVNPWNTLTARAAQLGLLRRAGKKFAWDGKEFNTLKALVASLKEDRDAVEGVVIRTALVRTMAGNDDDESLEGL